MQAKTSSLIAWIFIFSGIAIRYHLQFVSWSYNVDELNLGINIVQKSFYELLFPLDRGQSAPPLFLILEKVFFYFGKPNYSLKILPFISSCLSLFLFYKIIKDRKQSLYLLALGFLCFSPFTISNSLALKQYSLDLSLLLLGFILTYKKSNLKILLCFSIFFCLTSNIGSFFCISAILLIFLEKYQKECKEIEVKKILTLAAGPLLYSLYFLFFINQDGSEQLRDYMQNYWAEAFVPLNSEIFYWSLNRIKGLGFYILTSYLVIDVILLVIICIGLLSMFYKEKDDFVDFIQQNYLLIILIHLTLSLLKLYPFSDRLYLYLAPFLYLSLVKGLIICFQFLTNNLSLIKDKFLFYFSYSLLVVLIFQIPYQDNDIFEILEEKEANSEIYLTQKSHDAITLWLQLIKNKSVKDFLYSSKIFDPAIKMDKNALIISRQQIKYGHQKRTSEPEGNVQLLLNQNRIKLFKTLNGYKIYTVNR